MVPPMSLNICYLSLWYILSNASLNRFTLSLHSDVSITELSCFCALSEKFQLPTITLLLSMTQNLLCSRTPVFLITISIPALSSSRWVLFSPALWVLSRHKVTSIPSVFFLIRVSAILLLVIP